MHSFECNISYPPFVESCCVCWISIILLVQRIACSPMSVYFVRLISLWKFYLKFSRFHSFVAIFSFQNCNSHSKPFTSWLNDRQADLVHAKEIQLVVVCTAVMLFHFYCPVWIHLGLRFVSPSVYHNPKPN